MRAALLVLLMPAVVSAQVAKPATPPTASQVLANVEATYKKPPTLTATFEQVVTYATFGTTSTTGGTLALSKPAKFRFDYKPTGKRKLGRSFVFDGTTLWVVDPANLQIGVQQVQSSTLPVAITFFNGGSLASQFTPSIVGNYNVPGSTVLQLTPKQPSAQYKELYLVVDPSTWQVSRTVIIDSSGDTNTYKLSSVNLKATVPASTFKIDVASYPNYRIVKAAPPSPTPAKTSQPPMKPSSTGTPTSK